MTVCYHMIAQVPTQCTTLVQFCHIWAMVW